MKDKIISSILLIYATFAIIACGNGGGGNDNNGDDSSSQSYWAKSFGGSSSDGSFFSVAQQTTDGGFIIAGDSYSANTGNSDMLVIKTDATGSIIWQKIFSGQFFDGVSLIQQTNNGEYIVAGNTESFGSSIFSNNVWVLKLDASGDIIWQKAYGTNGFDVVNFIQQTKDNGYIIAGFTNFSSAGSNDFWVIKINASGSIIWQKTYGGSDFDQAVSIQQTNDDGYILAGLTRSFGAGSSDIWIIKLDTDGAVSWQKTIGGTGSDNASYIYQTSDAGYIVSGSTESFGAGNSDLWIIKLDDNGNIEWQKTYGSTGSENTSFIQQTSDNGYIVSASTDSFGAGNDDIWLLKLSSDGNITWQKTYGGTEDDRSYYSRLTSSNGYAVAGETQSFGAGMGDIWILKLKSDGTISPTVPSNIGADTVAIVQSTAVTPLDSLIAPVDSNALASDTSVSGVDANVSVQTQATNQ